MGTIILVALLTVETIFLAWSLKSKDNQIRAKSIIQITELILFTILAIVGALEWGFRYYLLFVVLVIQVIAAVVVIVKKTKETYIFKKSIREFIRNGLLYTFALSLALLCPQYKAPVVTGSYEVASAKYTWVDDSRIETFKDTGEKRALSVEFWYPANTNDKFPLVVFSHGAFGFSGSNYSTFYELASNGYIVASIGHTYHAFFTRDTNGKITTVDLDFLNSVNALNASNDPQQEYYVPKDWMNLRIADEHFVLDTIISEAKNESATLFSLIDSEHIGVIGHSLGGASFAQLARERDDISAVINLDGSMLGEEIDFIAGKVVLNDTPYPVPLLNIYAEDHYNNAWELVGEDYENFYASRNADCAYEVVFKNAGHLNFTDLPLFSPTLAKILGVGSIDPRYCIEKTNRLVLEFFDSYLKGGPPPQFEKEY